MTSQAQSRHLRLWYKYHPQTTPIALANRTVVSGWTYRDWIWNLLRDRSI